MLYSLTFAINTWINCASGHSGTQVQPLLRAADPRNRPCERALPHRPREVRNSHQKRGSYWGASKEIKGHTQCTSHLSIQWTHTHTRANAYSLTTTRFTVWTWRAPNRRTSSPTKPSTAVPASTRPSSSTSKRSPHQGQDRDERQGSRCSGTPSERTLITAPWKETKSTSHAKVIGKRYFARANSIRDSTISANKLATQSKSGNPVDVRRKEYCNMENVAGTTNCACGSKHQNLSTRGASSDFTPRMLRVHSISDAA